MKKYSLILLAFLLFFANVPLISAQEAINEVQEATPSQHISWVAQKFGVFKSWIRNELAKGYTLTHIYEELLEKQHGRSYEAFIQSLYPHTENGNPIVRSRTKRALPLAVPVVITAVRVAPTVGRALVSVAVVVQEFVRKPNLKKQGRERLEKKKLNGKYVSRTSGKNPNRPMKKHTPSKKHKGGKK